VRATPGDFHVIPVAESGAARFSWPGEKVAARAKLQSGTGSGSEPAEASSSGFLTYPKVREREGEMGDAF
jgi:hypothetical protein